MRPCTTKEALRAAVREAGLGELAPDELDLLETLYRDAGAFGDALRNAVAGDDQPATVFQARGLS
jgi:hypothetical protein